MRKIFTRYVLTLVFAAWASICFADIDENFNTLRIREVAVIEGWSLTSCQGIAHGGTNVSDDYALWFASPSSNEYPSKAITPAIGKNCNASLLFTYRKSNKTESSSFKVKLNNGGSFNQYMSVTEQSYNVENYSYSEAFLTIYGASETTTLTFEITSEKFFVIDDLKLTTSTPITISESGTTTSFTAQLADVTLGRSLAAGVWSTMCLPFDVTTEMMAAALDGVTEVKM